MTRTDIHRPSAPDFDPEAYRLVDVYDLHWQSTDHRDLSKAVEELAKQSVVQAPHSTGCGHCGQTNLRYVALLVRDDVNEWIFVGQDCLVGRFTSMTKAKFTELRKAAELERQKQAVKTSWLAFCAANPAMAYASYADNISLTMRQEARELGLNTAKRHGDDHLFASGTNWGLNVMEDIARKSRRYGDASAKQVALIERILGELETKWNAYLVREVAKLSEPAAAPLTAGRQVLEGVVLAAKWYDNDFGGALKMTVKLDGGQRVFGSVPASIDNVDKGDRVRFTATVEPKDEEPDFGFFKRPTKGEVVAPFVKSEAA